MHALTKITKKNVGFVCVNILSVDWLSLPACSRILAYHVTILFPVYLGPTEFVRIHFVRVLSSGDRQPGSLRPRIRSSEGWRASPCLCTHVQLGPGTMETVWPVTR